MIEFALGLGWVTLTLLGLWFFIGMALLEYEEGPGWSALLTGVLLIFACWWFAYDPITAVQVHWYDLLFYAVAWFVLGAGWSAFRFWRFADKLATRAQAWLDLQRQRQPEATVEALKSHEAQRALGYDDPLPPHPKHNKSRIISWILFWPQSMFWFALNDPIRRLAEFVYEQLAELLAAVGRFAFRNVR